MNSIERTGRTPFLLLYVFGLTDYFVGSKILYRSERGDKIERERERREMSCDDTPSHWDPVGFDFWRSTEIRAGRLIELREPETEEESFLGRIQFGN